MQSDKEILNLIVFTQELDNRFRYGIFAISSLTQRPPAEAGGLMWPKGHG